MTEEQFNALWTLEDIPACPVGIELLRRFAETYPKQQGSANFWHR